MTDVDPPPLAGPSEMSLSLAITANPDVLSLDGSSQTLITIEARDTNGQLAPNVPLRVQILADGQAIDFGTHLGAHARHGQQRARDVHLHGAVICATARFRDLQLSVTPTGNDASAHVRQSRHGPAGAARHHRRARQPRASRSFPARPAAFTDVRFDGSTSTAGLGAVITSYVWDFGDGSSGTGVTATHQYSAAGNYLVR